MTAHTTGSRDFTSSNTEERFSEETIFAKSAVEAGVDGSCAGAVGSGSGAAAEWNTIAQTHEQKSYTQLSIVWIWKHTYDRRYRPAVRPYQECPYDHQKPYPNG